MKEKKNLILIVMGVLILIIVGVGFTYAYFSSNVETTGSGGTASGTTATLENTELKLEPLNGAQHYEYPGGTGYTGAKVVATNKNADDTKTHYIDYKLILEYTNPTSTVLNYRLYESDGPVTGEPTCSLDSGAVDGSVEYKYNCTGLSYGKEVANGTLEANKTSATSLTIPQLYIETNNTPKYYYVVVDYPDNGGDQSVDQAKTIKYTLKSATDMNFIEQIPKKRTSDEMLAVLKSLNSSLTSSPGETSFTGGSETNEGLKSGVDDDGTTYYFRGSVNNNWVRIGSMYFRIIRINGDGTVRLIYSGTTAPTSSNSDIMTGEGTQLDGTSAFNINNNHNAYVGYMYGSTSASTYAETHANVNSSTIKEKLDTWYSSNSSTLSSVVDTNAGFCGDRKVVTGMNSYTGNGTGIAETAYAPLSRFMGSSDSASTQKPIFTCSQINDLYTLTSSNKGNKALNYPVGLITADEVVFAGGFATSGTYGASDFYLFTGKDFWTMSPAGMRTSAGMFYVNMYMNMRAGGAGSENGVRPVINLKSNLTWSGTGEWNSPFSVS